MYEEICIRTWESLFAPTVLVGLTERKRGSPMAGRQSYQLIVLRGGRADHMGKGLTEICSLQREHFPDCKIGDRMQTSLQGIAKKARERRDYRFGNLYTMLNEANIIDTWKYLNHKSAPGHDKKTAREYEQDLEGNVKDLVERLKRKSYKARLVKRVNIPKGNGKLRPLGLPVVEDKLLQATVTRILSAIYEQDFLPISYGYRPNVGPKDAVRDLKQKLMQGRYTYIVEADIKGYFDSIDHEWLIKMLEQRVNDMALIRLIKKWLKAGVLDTNGQVLHPVTGTPQGGVISPILANIYLHYALDMWFEKVVKPQCEGEAHLCRFADDFVCAFRFKRDADKFFKILPERLRKFNLELAADKTQILRFSRFDKGDGNSFDFLGFEFRWKESRNKKDYIHLQTAKKKFKNSIRNFTLWLKDHRSYKLRHLFPLLNSKLRGYYNYYGVTGNFERLAQFFRQVERLLFKWLNRRSQRRSFNWTIFKEICQFYALEKPRITEKRECQLSLNLP
jgi:RNA-directed DNA polymerase